MFFGLTIEKLLVIAVIAAFVVGPERLPKYAETLANVTKRARTWLSTARTRVKDEMGDDFDDLDWRTLDPRQYDPRRIIREALLDDVPAPPKAQSASMPTMTSARPTSPFTPGEVPPFDVEAT